MFEQLTFDFDMNCDCFYASYIWSWETKKFEHLACIFCGSENDRPRPEAILQKKVLEIRKRNKRKGK